MIKHTPPDHHSLLTLYTSPDFPTHFIPTFTETCLRTNPESQNTLPNSVSHF